MPKLPRRSSVGPQLRRRLDPRRAIVIHHVTNGPAAGWLHTHGLSAHGKPELEIRSVPVFLGCEASALLNAIGDYLLNDATTPLLAGQTMQCGRSVILFVEGRPEPDAGYDPGHYQHCVRLILVDPPEMGCACEECASERARGSGSSH